MASCLPLRTAVCVGIVAIPAALAAAPEPAAAEVATRIRFEWGGGPPRTWNGLLELDEGRFENLVPLGVDDELPGHVSADGTAIWIRRRLPRLYAGFDVTIRGPRSAALAVTLQSSDGGRVQSSFEVDVARLRRERTVAALGTEKDRCIVRRAPGDAIGVELSRSHLVFDPGETFEADVTANVAPDEWAGDENAFRWSLRTGDPPRTIDWAVRRLDAEDVARGAFPLRIHLPQTPGVYDVELELVRGDEPVHRRRVQLIVVDREPRAGPVGRTKWKPRPVDAFSPSEFAGRARALVESGESGLPDSLRDWAERLRVLPKTFRDGEPSRRSDGVRWSAHRLRPGQVGEPHRLVVTLDGSLARTVSLHVLQPNAAGQLVPPAPGTAFDVEPPPSPADAPAEVRRSFVFWPTTREPVLVAHADGAVAELGLRRVEVFETDRDADEATNTAAEAVPMPRERLVGPVIEQPFLPELFGAPEAFDEPTGRSLDDWHTFDVAAGRLARHLHDTASNAVLLSVLADGSSLHPSRHLRPTPRYDTGLHFSDARDPVRKDVVELLLRRFERERLSLVPMLEFTAPLPALERRRTEQGDRWRSIELRGPDVPERPHTVYNALDPHVQAALVDVVREFAERYRSHASLPAIALDLRHGHALLPGPRCGYDGRTLARFERDTGVRLPKSGAKDADAARDEFLNGPVHDAWIAWRTNELSRFHARLVEAVTAARPDLGCFVVLPPGSPSPLAQRGVDVARLRDLPRTTIVARAATPDAPGGSTERSVTSERGGGLLFPGRRETVRLTGFDEISPWGQSVTWLVSEAASSDVARRKRLNSAFTADAVACFEPLTMHVPEDGRDERAAFASLPAAAFRSPADVPQPLVVRVGEDGDRRRVVVVNEFPHAVVVKLAVSDAAESKDTESDDAEAEDAAAAGERVVELDGYGVRVLEFPLGASLESVGVVLTPEARLALRSRLQSLDTLLSEAVRSSKPREDSAAADSNGSTPATRVPDWRFGDGPAGRWTAEREARRSAAGSLVLIGHEDRPAAASSEIDVDGDRHLLVTARLRGDRDGVDVWLLFDAEIDGEIDRRRAKVSVSTDWRPYAFRIEDVDGDRVERARVRFEVRHRARVWIDDVEVHRRWLSGADVRVLQTTYAAARLALDEKRYADCRRLLEAATVRTGGDTVAAPRRSAERHVLRPIAR